MGANQSTERKLIRVEGIGHFIDERRGFFKVANHFYTYIEEDAFDHHFLITDAKSYDNQKYRISFIHYRQPDNEQSDDWAVVEEDLLVFQRDASSCKFELIKDPCNYFDLLERGKWWQIDHPKYPKHEYDRDEAVHRARQRRGEREYNIVSNNCEHFVTEILTGSKRCDQVGVRGLVRSSTASSATSFRLLPKWLRNSAPSSVASSAAATATATSAASNAAVKSSTPSYRNRVLMAFFVAFLLSLLVSNYAMSCVLLAAIMIFIKFF